MQCHIVFAKFLSPQQYAAVYITDTFSKPAFHHFKSSSLVVGICSVQLKSMCPPKVNAKVKWKRKPCRAGQP